jgi:cardiolipin synthase
MWLVALLSCLATLLVVFVVVNLGSSEKKIEQRLPRLYATDDAQFARSLGVLLGPPIVDGNTVRELRNGIEIFPAMLEAIRAARRSITFETYIYWSGSIGREFADALAERARAGVRVHVLLDWAGSVKMDPALLDEMRQAGAQIERYHKPHWSHLPRLNNRTHRKLLVVDGALGFTGGVGIADQWRGNAEDAAHWRDTHFRVEGPVVAQMQAVYIDNWMKASGRVLHGEDYFPALDQRGALRAQMFSSSPTGGSESMHLMYLMAITAAARSVDLSSSYFVPDELAVRALIDAAKRGVKVRIITPGPYIDAAVTRRASRARWGRLLEAGIEIAEYQPTMYHCKVLIVDALLVSVGSTNFDNRSFRLNDEANLNVLDADFAARQLELFEHDLQHARPVSLQAWRRRPWREKLIEHAASLIGAQL